MSECQRLRRDVELALSGPDPLRVLPLLHRLAARAESGSDECVFAHRQLAEVLLERDPWRAALHARRVTRMRPDDDRAWAALGLSQSLLGNHQYAIHALARALDCARRRTRGTRTTSGTRSTSRSTSRARRSSTFAAPTRRSGKNADVATSLAHALARSGKTRTAKALLARALKQSPSPERRALMRWIDAGAQGRATVCGVVQLFASREPPSRRPSLRAPSDVGATVAPSRPRCGAGSRAFRSTKRSARTPRTLRVKRRNESLPRTNAPRSGSPRQRRGP